ncbi:MAG: sugar ABC transporter permease [Treponema sp. GWB1_62_6]|nr:MAG: sugar ABC transporter permease [Treponema sp. GWC1_61_84]OHE70248.1 MAG: sugar ABC transporter permease [Treponema sp. GWB1_62_6]OHE75869.1 MAG: sugar ABC transporter permease [Treponema sp. RIFOXYC1_FULL_61_9]HCM26394.1 carbohydrate ABC transporter permease [Treponema sp.]
MKRRSKLLRNILTLHLPVLLIVLFAVGPYVWTFISSVTPQKEMDMEFRYLPEHATMDNYARLFGNLNFGTNVKDSFIVALGSTILGMTLTLTASYSFSRFNFRFKQFFLIQFLVINMFPIVLLIIPLFVMMKNLGIMDTHFALMIAYSTFTIPFATWMMTGFFRAIPRELDESAQIDGLGRFGTFVRVIVPIALPGVSATGIYIFINSWNEFIYASILTSSAVRTIPVSLQNMVGEYQIAWGLLTAGGVVAAIPILTMFFFIQKTMISGMTAGAVKG